MGRRYIAKVADTALSTNLTDYRQMFKCVSFFIEPLWRLVGV